MVRQRQQTKSIYEMRSKLPSCNNLVNTIRQLTETAGINRGT